MVNGRAHAYEQVATYTCEWLLAHTRTKIGFIVLSYVLILSNKCSAPQKTSVVNFIK